MTVNRKAVRINPEYLNGDMHLAASVLNVYGEKIATEGTKLTPSLISRILISGVNYVYVYGEAKSMSAPVLHEVVDADRTEFAGEFDRVAQGGKIDQDNIVDIVTSSIRNAMQLGGVEMYLDALRQKSEYTYTHCMAVSILCNQFGKWLNLTGSEHYDLMVASSLHDIGKLNVDTNIIEKKGLLLPHERAAIEEHVLHASKILDDVRISERIKRAIMQHHEKMDGTGYPLGLRAGEISTYGSILAIVDCYDALISKRSYRDAMSPFSALEIMSKEKFATFRFDLFEKFAEKVAYAHLGAEVELTDGTTGEIVFINPSKFETPMIRTAKGDIVDMMTNPRVKIERIG